MAELTREQKDFVTLIRVLLMYPDGKALRWIADNKQLLDIVLRNATLFHEGLKSNDLAQEARDIIKQILEKEHGTQG